MLDSLSAIHHDKIKFGQIKSEYLIKYGTFLYPESQAKKLKNENNMFSE